MSEPELIGHMLCEPALDRDLVDLARRFGLGDGATTVEWEYLLLTARRRA